MPDHAATPSTQTAHPWRATARTVFAFLVGLAAAWALIIEATGIDPGMEWAGITNVMALPVVDDLIRRFVPWLAPGKEN